MPVSLTQKCRREPIRLAPTMTMGRRREAPVPVQLPRVSECRPDIARSPQARVERGAIEERDDRARELTEIALEPNERILDGTIDDTKLLRYVGKKAISRQGCFACHDIPGFENSKPIGTALNDWGKKDPERLAFEDVALDIDRDERTLVELRCRVRGDDAHLVPNLCKEAGEDLDQATGIVALDGVAGVLHLVPAPVG